MCVLLIVPPFITSDRNLILAFDYVAVVGLVVSYMVLLVIPKVWPPCKRKFLGKHKTVRVNVLGRLANNATTTTSKQVTNSNTIERLHF